MQSLQDAAAWRAIAGARACTYVITSACVSSKMGRIAQGRKQWARGVIARKTHQFRNISTTSSYQRVAGFALLAERARSLGRRGVGVTPGVARGAGKHTRAVAATATATDGYEKRTGEKTTVNVAEKSLKESVMGHKTLAPLEKKSFILPTSRRSIRWHRACKRRRRCSKAS